LLTTRTFHELFEPYGMKNNYGIPQGPIVQLSIFFTRIQPALNTHFTSNFKKNSDFQCQNSNYKASDTFCFVPQRFLYFLRRQTRFVGWQASHHENQMQHFGLFFWMAGVMPEGSLRFSERERERERERVDMADEQTPASGRHQSRGADSSAWSSALECLKALRQGDGRQSKADGGFQIKMDPNIRHRRRGWVWRPCRQTPRGGQGLHCWWQRPRVRRRGRGERLVKVRTKKN
jgi:hypothetical protein